MPDAFAKSISRSRVAAVAAEESKRMMGILRQHRWLILLWLCFVVRGVFYSSVLPLWEGFDEWAHFAVAQNMAISGRAVIDRHAAVSQEVNTSLQLVPLPRGMTRIVSPSVTRDAYWQLPD